MLRQNAHGWRTLAIVLAIGALVPGGAILARGGDQGHEAPVLSADRAAGRVIPDHYIVVFKKGAKARDLQGLQTRIAKRPGVYVHQTYRTAVRGFAAMLSKDALAEVRRDPNVAYVERDRVVTLSTTQTNATWGLDRIDQRSLPLNGTYIYDVMGSAVTVYVIDTGIRTTHNEFGGRATVGTDTVGDGQNGNDCNGHGTHVAGTIGGTTYGVAKDVDLVAVRVLNCSGSGSTSGVIAGIDWVTQDHAAGTPAVANMSLGGGASTALDNAVVASINDGVVYAIAAGNSNANACNTSPARVEPAITVGATTSTDARSSFSNFGTCLDLFAPGSSITSAWNTSDSATNTISGTSMASPHVAGVAALYLDLNPGASPQQVRDAIVNNATSGVVGSPGSGSPNLLLHSRFGGAQPTPTPTPPGPGPTPTPPPTPTPTPPPSTCDGYNETYSGSLSGTGAAQYQPNGTYYFSASSGTHRGKLQGPAGTDFDLYLQRWNGLWWSTVAASESATSIETINYFNSSTNRYFRWRIYSFSGSGPYTFCLTRP